MMHALFAMTLLSNTFTQSATVPKKMVAKDCGGSNVSPELHWSSVPGNAKSLVLIVHDPDAPLAGGYYHWAVSNLAPKDGNLGEGVGLGYYGPCPPPGKVHHYHFTLYALDEANVTNDWKDAGAGGQAAAKTLLANIQGHIVAQTTLTGLYQTMP